MAAPIAVAARGQFRAGRGSWRQPWSAWTPRSHEHKRRPRERRGGSEASGGGTHRCATGSTALPDRHYDLIVTIDPTTVYFVGNRLWWLVALFLSPIAGAIARQPVVAILATAPASPARSGQGSRRSPKRGHIRGRSVLGVGLFRLDARRPVLARGQTPRRRRAPSAGLPAIRQRARPRPAPRPLLTPSPR